MAGKQADGQGGAGSGANEKVPYPKRVLLILICEFCERFCYYGISTILLLYFTTILHLSQRTSTIMYHLFCAFCYFTPIIGGVISDNWLGKFKTIFYISLICIAGQILLCLTSSPLRFPKLYITILSLFLIAIGAGGIKPCISAFGGDQFTLPQQEKHLHNFFFVYYFFINCGFAASVIVTRLLKDQRCFDEDTCFPLAFGVPAGVMILIIILFIAGRPFYKVQRAEGTVMASVFRCICRGLYKKCHHPKGDGVQHWLDRTNDKFDKELIEDVKECFRIGIIFFLGTAFWSLYDQMDTTWRFQAARMNGTIGAFVILPYQFQLMNAFLILIMIPTFNLCIYPLCSKMNVLRKELSRMCCGGYLLASSFAMVGALSLVLEANEPELPQAGVSHLRIYNSLKCTPLVTSKLFNAPIKIDSMDFTMIKVNVKGEIEESWNVGDCAELPEKNGKFTLEEKKSISYYLSKKGMIKFEDDVSKDEAIRGYPKLRLLVDDPDLKLELTLKTEGGDRAGLRSKKTSEIVLPSWGETDQYFIHPGKIKITGIDKLLDVRQGGVYVIFIETEGQSMKDFTKVEVTKPNHISMFWQAPQYVLSSAGEVMFSISCIQFGYSQAPVTMKAFVQALCLLHAFFGNMLTTAFVAANLFLKGKVPYPKRVLLILFCEFCERFCYYGVRTVLLLYFVAILHLSQRTSTIIYHLFCAFCFFTPIIGGVISDNWLGKFKTIFYISLICIVGQILLSLTSSPLRFPKLYITMLSLFLIAIGAGGIKPCIAAFGGDQFTLPQQEKHLDNFFFVFYFIINFGSATAMFITPILEAQRCFDEITCFPLAFGIPAGVMILVIIFFIAGKPFYTVQRAEGTVMARVFRCICRGLYKKCHHPKGDGVQHWLDRTNDKYDKQLIEDVKECFRIGIIFFLGTAFWSLYDQSDTTWRFQAARMDGTIGPFVVLPDQFQIINPVLILIMIPTFNLCIYPLCSKMNILRKQLSRMCCGGYLLASSFALVAALSLVLEANEPEVPQAGVSHLRIYNSLKCTPLVTSKLFDAPIKIDSMDFTMIKVDVKGEIEENWNVGDCPELPEKNGKFTLEEKKSISYYLSKKGVIKFEDDASKDVAVSGYPKLRLLVDDPDLKLELTLKTEGGDRAGLRSKKTSETVQPSWGETDQYFVHPGKIKITGIDKLLHVRPGGVYVIFIETEGQSMKDFTQVEVTKPNHFSMFWQIPQYILSTAGEVMFSISGLQFAYSQAPVTMKAFVQALWLLNTFFGNMVTSVFVAAHLFSKGSSENLFFSALMVLVTTIFAFGMRQYKYVETKNVTSK